MFFFFFRMKTKTTFFPYKKGSHGKSSRAFDLRLKTFPKWDIERTIPIVGTWDFTVNGALGRKTVVPNLEWEALIKGQL